jgi:hypothetical protein
MIPDNIRTTRDRAHLYGADWVNAQKDGDHQRATESRARYFRELEALSLLMGDVPSSFAGLG